MVKFKLGVSVIGLDTDAAAVLDAVASVNNPIEEFGLGAAVVVSGVPP